MSDQFNLKRFARGVKLTGEHLTTPLTSIQTAAGNAAIANTAESLGVGRATWIMPWTQATDIIMPFAMPPFQEMFDRDTLEDPDYPVTLTELSFSFDQRGEALAVGGYPGVTRTLRAPDMNRLTTTLTLWERTPTIVSNPTDTNKAREVFRLELSGEEVFGNAFSKGNPFLLGDLNTVIKPFSTYFWRIETPGLPGDGSGAKYECTIGGAYIPGDTARLSVDATNYDYVVQLGDTDDMVAAGVGAVAAVDPRVQPTPFGGGTGILGIDVRNPSDNPIIATSFLAGVGTFVTVNTAPAVSPTKYPIALPSLTVSAVFCSPLTRRDENDALTLTIQNMPVKHQGDKVGTAIALTAPVANAIITGTDIQDAQLGDFDRTLRERAESGYGAGFGALANPMQAADAPVEELLVNDSHYLMIVVPLWGGFGGVGAELLDYDVPAVGLPNLSAPWTGETTDRRVMPIPENFVLHHAFVAWNNQGGFINPAATYEQKVSVSISSGRNADTYLEQLVAYLEWTGANYATYRVDEYTSPNLGTIHYYSLLSLPLVGPVGLANDRSWNAGGTSGLPFYMGRANSTTNTRSDCGQNPPAFGGGGYITPATEGGENLLEVRWSKQDATLGLYGQNGYTVIGAGGEWVILCGKVVLSA